MRINQLIRYSEYLPCYLVEPVDSSINCLCWEREVTTFNGSEQSITLHLQINTQIEKMIHTVTTVLKNLNPSKLKTLSLKAQSVEQLQCILEKPENQVFISSLLHSKFIQDRAHMRTELCTVMQGRTRLIQDIGKFKKNLVFRLEIPESLAEIYGTFTSKQAEPGKPLPAKDLAESSFEQLLQMKKRVGSNVSIIPGYQILQKGSSTGGIAVIDRAGTSISYLAGEPTRGKTKNTNNITIIMQSPKITDHEYVIEKMSEMNEIILARPRNKVEEVSLRIAKRNMKASKTITQEDMNSNEQIKEQILKKLSNEERMAIAQKSAKLKNSVVNSTGDSQPVPIAELLKGTVDRHSLLKLVRNSTDFEREIMFKSTEQGGMGIGELLMDKNDLTVMSRLEDIHQAKNVALVEKECNYRVPKKLNVGIDSQFGILKIEHDVSKREIFKSCNVFEKRIQTKKEIK